MEQVWRPWYLCLRDRRMDGWPRCELAPRSTCGRALVRRSFVVGLPSIPVTVNAGHRSRPDRSRLGVYLSFANADRRMAAQMRVHLAPLERSGMVSIRWDEDVAAGQRWDDLILRAVDDSDVFILLLSPNVLASGFFMDHELPAIHARAQSSNALIVPVILRPCIWEPFWSGYQAVPLDKGRVRPISLWKPLDSGYHKAAEQIRESIDRHFAIGYAFDYPAGGARRLTDEQVEHAVRAVVGRRLAGG